MDQLTVARYPHYITASLTFLKHTKPVLFPLQPTSHSGHQMCGVLYIQTLTSSPIPNELHLCVLKVNLILLLSEV